MAAPKRTRMQREADLETVARLYLQKQTQAEIAQRLGLSQQQLSYDLKTIQRRWQESAVSSFEARKAEELARIDRLEREYWDAWERSRGQAESTTRTATGVGGDALRRAVVRTEDRDGDPRFLEGVRWCIQKRVEILGLDAPVKHEDVTIDNATRAARIAAILDAARARRYRQPDPGLQAGLAPTGQPA